MVAVLKKGVVMEDLTEKATLKQNLEGGKRMIYDSLEGEHSKWRKQPVQKEEKCVSGMLKE